jgi:hypothetical protein
VPGLAKNKHRFVVAARPTWEAKFVAVPEPMWSRRAAAIEQKDRNSCSRRTFHVGRDCPSTGRAREICLCLSISIDASDGGERVAVVNVHLIIARTRSPSTPATIDARF